MKSATLPEIGEYKMQSSNCVEVGQGYSGKCDPAVYQELKQIARRIRFKTNAGNTLHTTALVHEAYIRLSSKSKKWENERHFFCYAATTIRNILIDQIRMSKSRGPNSNPDVSIENINVKMCGQDENILKLNDAMLQMETFDKVGLKVVECRFFAGYTIDETAHILDISPSSVKRSWRFARNWLYHKLQAT